MRRFGMTQVLGIVLVIFTISGREGWAAEMEGNNIVGTDSFGDPLPSDAVSRLGTTRWRHSDIVWKVAFSSDNECVASASDDGTISLWEFATGRQKRRFIMNGLCNTVGISSDRKMIAGGGYDEGIHIWQLDTGELLLKLRGHEASVNDVAFSPKSDLLASAGEDGSVRLWNLENGNCTHVLEKHKDSVSCVVFSPDGILLASASRDRVVHLWEPRTGRLVGTLKGHDAEIHGVSFSRDGNMIATASGGSALSLTAGSRNDVTVRIWDAVHKIEIGRIVGKEKQISSVSFSPAGDSVAIADGKRVRIVQWQSGRELKSWSFPFHVMSVQFSPDGKHLAAAVQGSTVYCWDVDGLAEPASSDGHTGVVDSVAFFPDGQTLLSGGHDNVNRVWRLSSSSIAATIPWNENLAFESALAKDGSLAATSLGTGAKGVIVIWDPATRLVKQRLQTPRQLALSLDFSPDGRRLAAVSFDSSGDASVIVWTLSDGAVESNWPHEYVSRLAFSPDGRTLASSARDRDGRLYLWDVQKRRRVRELDFGELSITAFCWLQDDSSIVVVMKDGEFLIVNPTDGQIQYSGDLGNVKLEAVVSGVDSKALVGACTDGTVRTWSLDGRAIQVRHGHRGTVNCLAISHDGTRIASGGADTTILIWKAADLLTK